MSEYACEWHIETFSAMAEYTGEGRLVRVTGQGSCPQGGYEVTLDFANPGPVSEPERLYLRLVEQPPQVGTDVLTNTSVEQTFDVSQEVTEVVIRGVGSVQVQEPPT